MESEQTAPTVDPFAENGNGGEDPFAGGAEPPIVNKEGDPVEPQAPPEPQAPAEVPDAPAAETQPISAQDPSEPVDDPTPDPAPEPAAAGGGADAPADAPAEPKSPMRRYRILYQTAPDQWTEAEWDETEGKGKAKKTRICHARNNEHALRLAFGILGEPENGVTVLPVPDSGFKPKRLKRKAVVPRTALDISD